MSETSTNGAVDTLVNRARARARKRAGNTNGRDTVPMTNGDNGRHEGAKAVPAPQDDGGRDGRGRFVRGNAGGPGNPFARRVAKLRQTLCETVTEADIEVVARKLMAQAKEGDVAAARLLLSYTIGRPAPAVDPDTLDLAEWDIHRRTPINLAEARQFITGIPIGLMCKIVNAVAPFLEARVAAAMGEVLQSDPADLPAAMERAARILDFAEPEDVELDDPDLVDDEPSTNGATANSPMESPDCPLCGSAATANGPMESRDYPICRPVRSEDMERETTPQSAPAPAARQAPGKGQKATHARRARPAAQSTRTCDEPPPGRAPSTNRSNRDGGSRPAPT